MAAPKKKAKALKHAVKKAAKARKRAVKKAKAARTPDDDFTIPEWCRLRRIGRTTFYKMVKDGTAPKIMKLRKCVRITPKADAEWQAERERETAAAMEAAA
ncbi:putative DNA-binding transcriptional regulator AlpA [Bradyrhizobium elkanii]